MSGGKSEKGIFMYSGRGILDPRKKFLISTVMKRAPLLLSEMVLLIINLVSRRFAAGEAGSSGYTNLSPPTTNRTLDSSSFKGL